jgi:hypothetical protein
VAALFLRQTPHFNPILNNWLLDLHFLIFITIILTSNIKNKN